MRTYFVILVGGNIRQVKGKKMVSRYQEPTLIFADDAGEDLVAVIPTTALVFTEVMDLAAPVIAPQEPPKFVPNQEDTLF